jgi:hypothetical protein
VAVVREVDLEIDELRARDVALFKIRPPRHDLIGDLRIGEQMGRAVEHAQVGIAQTAVQGFGIDQEFGMGEAGGGHDPSLQRGDGSGAAIAGRCRWNSVACSKAWPTRSTAASANGGPAIWKASGRPFSKPIGTDRAGAPVRL